MNRFDQLKSEIKQCRLCETELEAGANPVVQLHPEARILIAGQAPGKKAHLSSVPFDDASGERLRHWMGIDKDLFYNESKIAILPMGFCYPGKGKSGDLPPRKECTLQWRVRVLDTLPDIRLTLLIGQYAMKWHLGTSMEKNLTETVRAWRQYSDTILPLPHPSPRNFSWFKNNPWFEQELLPTLRKRVELSMT